LFISTFGVNLNGKTPDAVFFIDDIGSAVSKNSFQIQRIAQPVIWPNEVNLIDNRYLVVPGGFLVPGKKGHISIMDYKLFRDAPQTRWTELVKNDHGFFHRVEKINLLNKAAQSGDNGERFLTCRGYKSVLGKSGGEMVYLDPKEDGTMEIKEIAKGCDCFFAPIDLNKDGIPEFIIPAFFGQKAYLLWTEHPLGDFTQPEYIRQRVIDNEIGAAFDVQIIDLDGDGVEEVIMTNHQNGKKGTLPSVFAYQIVAPSQQALDELEARGQTFEGDQFTFSQSGPKNRISLFMENVEFRRHTLSNNFKVINRSFMAAAPGAAQVVSTGKASNYTYPVIVVSGDGSEKAYLLTRDSTEDRWSYHQEIFHDCKGTVGGITVEDIDNDGWSDVIVPCYDTNKVVLYTFAPLQK